MTGNNAKIGILRWEEGQVPEGLLQLERMPGNSTNPASYPFPVKMVHVPGACVETIITNPKQEVLDRMIEIAKEMQDEGVKGIATSCGFNAVYQQKLAEVLDIPVFTSSILQVPFAQRLIGNENTVAVITANKGSLSKEHMAACGITEDMNVMVFGLEHAVEFSKIFDKPDEKFDMEAVEKEIVGTAVDAVKNNPSIKAIVLECTDLPPFRKKISEAVNLPVFDINTMMGYMAIVFGDINLY